MNWLLSHLVAALLPSLGTVVAGYVIVVLHRLAARFKFELTAAQEARIRQIIIDAINSVEERAATSEVVQPSAAKLDQAIRAVQQQLPELPAAEINARIHELLPTVRPPKPTLPQVIPQAPPSMQPGGGRR